MSSSNRRVAILLPLLLLAGLIGTLVTACASAPPPTTPTVVPTPAVDANGQPIMKEVGAKATPNPLAGWSVAISKVGRAKTISEPGLVPMEAKGVFLILHLDATNGNQAASVFPLASLSAKDSTGKEYKVDQTASEHYSIGAKLPNQTGSIAPKGKLEVGVVLDVDPAATGLNLNVAGKEIPIQE